MKMKMVSLVATVAALVMSHSEPVSAHGPLTVNGKWAGTAFASAIDLNGDGSGARTFNLTAYDQLPFVALEGIVDSGLIALPGQGSCTDPNAIELVAFGKLTFRGRGKDALFTTVDPNAPHLCFNPAAPNELLVLKITGGTGIYAGRTGTGTAQIHDIVLEASPQGFPLMIDTQGEFSLTIQ